MRPKNKRRTERVQLSISDNTNRILQGVADIGILGKTKSEVAARIVTDWIWANEDRLLRQGIRLREESQKRVKRGHSGRGNVSGSD
jgi:hypothetical protein